MTTKNGSIFYYYVIEGMMDDMRVISRHETEREANEMVKSLAKVVKARRPEYKASVALEMNGSVMFTNEEYVAKDSFVVMASRCSMGGGDMIQTAEQYTLRNDYERGRAMTMKQLDAYVAMYGCESVKCGDVILIREGEDTRIDDLYRFMDRMGLTTSTLSGGDGDREFTIKWTKGLYSSQR